MPFRAGLFATTPRSPALASARTQGALWGIRYYPSRRQTATDFLSYHLNFNDDIFIFLLDLPNLKFEPFYFFVEVSYFLFEVPNLKLEPFYFFVEIIYFLLDLPNLKFEPFYFFVEVIYFSLEVLNLKNKNPCFFAKAGILFTEP